MIARSYLYRQKEIRVFYSLLELNFLQSLSKVKQSTDLPLTTHLKSVGERDRGAQPDGADDWRSC